MHNQKSHRKATPTVTAIQYHKSHSKEHNPARAARESRKSPSRGRTINVMNPNIMKSPAHADYRSPSTSSLVGYRGECAYTDRIGWGKLGNPTETPSGLDFNTRLCTGMYWYYMLRICQPGHCPVCLLGWSIEHQPRGLSEDGLEQTSAGAMVTDEASMPK
ncbi:hypothetical protein ASPVEDRAFT_752309 [Aspergillus versicolor CBS 583.65]|uniref:Uncharacterized protein n=1 Tax=Aspergillus versicolor CBS 583.65 TaxID=1036611 RepID=A0A1L9PQE4_ASPVE|nr:uncharacterized protein ASPVEDRAFT_752309 [Aspergillus versicolor CBS 583.65]OJJ03739.1 hypothetical protein ASPVEDRAFT_752309 [Aspergillus versicolor CBS 583.65]